MMTVTKSRNSAGEHGMTLIAVMAMLALFAVALLAAAPSVYYEVEREKELEAIRRGEEIAEAIRQYIVYTNGKPPTSIDDLLEGIPQGTKKRMILRPSAATDPLSSDGRWLLVKPDPQVIAAFAKRVQNYNNGLLPSNPSPHVLDRFSIELLVNLNTGTEDQGDILSEVDASTSSQPFIGVASQSKRKSILTYYGIEKHSNWIFTPLFRGAGRTVHSGRGFEVIGSPPPPPVRGSGP